MCVWPRVFFSRLTQDFGKLRAVAAQIRLDPRDEIMRTLDGVCAELEAETAVSVRARGTACARGLRTMAVRLVSARAWN